MSTGLESGGLPLEYNFCRKLQRRISFRQIPNSLISKFRVITVKLSSQFSVAEDEQVFAKLCREPESAIPLLSALSHSSTFPKQSDVESALCTGEKRKDNNSQLTVNWTHRPSRCAT